jgi:hypothetical protein
VLSKLYAAGGKEHTKIAKFKQWDSHKIGAGYIYYVPAGTDISVTKSSDATLHYWCVSVISSLYLRFLLCFLVLFSVSLLFLRDSFLSLYV